jgi:hypothetical protein
MESAGTKLVGEHDFRNFCKMDAANVHTYVRRITMFEIYATDVRLRLVDNFSYPYMSVLLSPWLMAKLCRKRIVEIGLQ